MRNASEAYTTSAVFVVMCSLAVSVFISFAASGLACHGRGQLKYNMQCECESEIFGGRHCEECNCKFGTCPEQGIGAFGTNNMCQCDDNWMGPLCDYCCAVGGAACLHVDSTSSQLECTGSNCVRNYYGAQCKKFCTPAYTCCNGEKPMLNKTMQDECVKHAQCTPSGDCECTDGYGWSYDFARCQSCPGTSWCSGNGLRCVNGPTCICKPGYYSEDCSKDCNCNKTAKDPINVNGFCTEEPGSTEVTCTCNVDINGQFKYITSPHSTTKCDVACPISNENGLVCGGHGQCAFDDDKQYEGKCKVMAWGEKINYIELHGIVYRLYGKEKV